MTFIGPALPPNNCVRCGRPASRVGIDVETRVCHVCRMNPVEWMKWRAMRTFYQAKRKRLAELEKEMLGPQ